MSDNKTLILKSAPIVKKSLEELSARSKALIDSGITPCMKVILVGDNPASIIYTRNKKRFMEKFGAECEIIKLDKDLTEKEFLARVDQISGDEKTHGCFVQLPLPKHLSHIDVGELIPPHKDVDGFNKANIISLYKGETGEGSLIPCTPKGIVTLCDYYGIELSSKNIVVIGRSLIVGKPLSMLLSNHNATITLCHSKTKNLEAHTKAADIIITAIGVPKFLKREHLSDSKEQYIIDVGINQNEDGTLCGDVDFKNVSDHVAGLTPVPGGIGPMTILSLAQNLLQAAEKSL
ncbi:bifunctional 5,10-methylene-tetrahydrofolate dehydrogenase/5,10-methylene-tetrahydrofolate cyclohydrolase [Halobacteriovorax marinus]|uniref:Bifunctional protein FolD n=1 Tax=Halobacteriovorax marinus (strain ATCC BAA-682 / DSM 15412 / SJ) TaxID=862908 RepID=E1X116_HALMS|nr:bifunctional 5,10-methylenetetrahydrofolate dehydrogenase/5,10-methenyltetrahydrofolate cyclohydrolase [Halobacteriovorax marinus]ATH09348.1 bifunctional 5,10-methylene-tetrahydrofolate dehydrogenase/5,10-methylene-tetrahydrofolate cyclohydrolase [Halobacteriovorax marinus]CBW28086.1 folD bifunctional protein [Halobacteriovorax marinus SJ]